MRDDRDVAAVGGVEVEDGLEGGIGAGVRGPGGPRDVGQPRAQERRRSSAPSSPRMTTCVAQP
jgi:hypothetical protein